MKKVNYSLLLILACTVHAFSQQNLSANVYTGWMFPFTDLTEADYVGYKPNLAVGAGIGYQVMPSVRLRGDLLYGSMNGNNERNYYETNIFEPQLGFDLNLIGLFKPDFDAFKLNFQGGTGMLFYTSRLYDQETGERLTESPVRSESAMSPNAFISYGFNAGIKLTEKLDLNVGITNRYVFDADYLDGQKSGEAGDHYGVGQIGLVYYLKSDRAPNTVEVDKSRFNDLVEKSEDLEKVESELDETREKMAEMEMEHRERELMLNDVRSKLDSARAALISGQAGPAPAQQQSADPEEVLGTPQYRLIVASLPSANMAQRWIDRSDLPSDEMVIAYDEEVNTYRVVYRSFDSFAAARKEQQRIKSQVSDAWIIKF